MGDLKVLEFKVKDLKNQRKSDLFSVIYFSLIWTVIFSLFAFAIPKFSFTIILIVLFSFVFLFLLFVYSSRLQKNSQKISYLYKQFLKDEEDRALKDRIYN